MNDGQPSQPSTPTPSAAPTAPSAPAPAPQTALVEASKSPWRIPEDVQAALQQLDLEIRSKFSKLGMLEAEYLAEKNAIVADLDGRKRLKFDLINNAAKNAGLDIDKARWIFDELRMTLTRAS